MWWQSGDDCCVIEYCSITNNTAKTYCCLRLNSAYRKQVRSCNIIYNRHLDMSNSNGLIHSSDVVTIENTCILGNLAYYQVFCSSSSTISNCSIDFSTSAVSGATITNTPKGSFVVKISCFSTASCESFYDSYGLLTVVPDSQSKTVKKIITCKDNRRLWGSNSIAELIILISFIYSE
jgi:hypothetical protein